MVTIDGQEGYDVRRRYDRLKAQHIKLIKINPRNFQYFTWKIYYRGEDLEKMKYSRHAKILELIEKYEIDTQEELKEKLKDMGWSNSGLFQRY